MAWHTIQRNQAVMMENEELRGIQAKYKQGLEKLGDLSACLERLRKRTGLEVATDAIDTKQGELGFWFAGTRYYVRIRIADRSIDNVGADARVPIGWLDWGRCNGECGREPAEQSNYFDDRGVLCTFEKDEFYCNFQSCNEERLQKGMLSTIGRLVGRTIAVNNAGPR
jgi:hypothetical protein